MPELDHLVLELRETNRRVDFWMNGFGQPATVSATMPPIVTSRQINGLLSELMTAGQFLRRLPAELDENVKAEVDEYRKRIEHLRDLLPRIHRSLLQERSRLEQERTRVQAASQWARASRQTR